MVPLFIYECFKVQKSIVPLVILEQGAQIFVIIKVVFGVHG